MIKKVICRISLLFIQFYFCFNYLSVLINSAIVFQVCEGGDFAAELDTRHTLQIYEKLSCEALKRDFFQLKNSEAKPVLCGRAIILPSNFLIQFNQKYQLP
jgi:hypothetical protein